MAGCGMRVRRPSNLLLVDELPLTGLRVLPFFLFFFLCGVRFSPLRVVACSSKCVKSSSNSRERERESLAFPCAVFFGSSSSGLVFVLYYYYYFV